MHILKITDGEVDVEKTIQGTDDIRFLIDEISKQTKYKLKDIVIITWKRFED